MSAITGRRKVVFSCPACAAPLVKRTSYLSHQFLRHDVYVCDNPVCGATYSGHTELTGIASPSGMPDAPPCDLPPTPAYRRALAMAEYRKRAHNQQLDLIADLVPGESPTS